MKTYSILLLLIISSITGHAQKKLFAKAMGLYKTPRWQTIEDIKVSSIKDSAYYDALYYLKTYEDWQYFNKNQLLSFPGVYIFDKNLKPVKALDATDCGWQAQRFVASLTDTTTTLPDERIKVTVQDLLNHSKFAGGDSSIIKEGDFDYLYVYTWVSYLPKFMKEQFKYSKEIKADTNVHIKIISLNADFMAEWKDHPEKFVGKKVK